MRIEAAKQQPPRTPQTDFGKKVLAHTRYYAADGKRIPGVTTVLGELAKPQLVGWANRLGLQGIDSNKYSDEAKLIGTLAHHLIQHQFSGETPDTSDFSANQIARANNAVAAFRAWLKGKKLEPILIEAQFVSEEFRFGGTVDCLGWLDGTMTLIDYKTSSGIYEDHVFQVGGYWRLLVEHGHEIKGARILHLPRNEEEGFSEKVLTGQQVLHGWQVFEHALAIYQLRKKRAS